MLEVYKKAPLYTYFFIGQSGTFYLFGCNL